MESIALEIKLECGICGNKIAINAMNVEFECKECLNYTQISYDAMQKNFQEIIEKIIKHNVNSLKFTGHALPFYLEGKQCTRLCGKEHPTYNGVQVDVQMIEKNIATGNVEIDGEKVLIRKVPKEFVGTLPPIKYLVGEDEEQVNHIPGAYIEKNKSTSTVLFSCLSCGGGLTIDGSERIVECKYCGNSSFIPDALWLKFHPVSIVKRWYMVW